ncbi:hypothetical protein CL653_01785 [bacterium]|nr:hypothetical protein [bacterium]|tara:strand:- start:5 stop:208 length:204 start_codon:yes stop_codon:yes gene_type:complete
MEIENNNRLESLEAKIDAVYKSVEKTRKYFLVVMWVTIALVVLPALGLIFAIPAFMKSYTSSLDALL